MRHSNCVTWLITFTYHGYTTDSHITNHNQSILIMTIQTKLKHQLSRHRHSQSFNGAWTCVNTTNEWMNERMYEWMAERMNERTHHSLNYLMYVRTNERTNNKWMITNKLMKKMDDRREGRQSRLNVLSSYRLWNLTSRNTFRHLIPYRRLLIPDQVSVKL